MKKSIAILLLACACTVLPSVTFSRDTGQKNEVSKNEVFAPTSVDVTFEVNSFAYTFDEAIIIVNSNTGAVDFTSKNVKFVSEKSVLADLLAEYLPDKRLCFCSNSTFIKRKTNYLFKSYPNIELPISQVPRC